MEDREKRAQLQTATAYNETGSTLDGSITAANELSLYAGHKSLPLVTAFFNSFNLQNAEDNGKRKKANLGTILGVYLPTLQHIFGVIMFLRLFWIVGIMGIGQSFAMVFLCCLCTFLTCISLSAVATNGVIESGGTYFMISRNLGPEFGTAVGILFYLANSCACAMYVVGAVEVLLLYIAPRITIGGPDVRDDTGLIGMMSNNYRVYGTTVLLLLFVIVALGVRFVQFFAPISLLCVMISVAAIFAGAIEKSIFPANHRVCYLNGLLLQANAYVPSNHSGGDLCPYCNFKNPILHKTICQNSTVSTDSCNNYTLTCNEAFPGIASGAFIANLGSQYMKSGEATPGHYADENMEVFQDVTSTFFVLLAVYFPSVTGIMTGANMSGDLKDPQKSLPQGTIAAQLTTTIVYMLLILAFGSTVAGPILRDKYGQSMGGSGMVVAEIAWPSPWVIMIGAFTSCFGAALQCLCSAPRLLQSIAKDDVLPFLRPFQVLTRWNEPFRCVAITVVLSELAILVAAIDRIAPIVDFFFLMCYAFVNLVCFLHSILGAPNWRPRFKCYHWTLSLLGTLLCLFIMFATHWLYAIIVIVLCGIIYKYVSWKGDKKEWGDGITGLVLSTAQFSLSKLEDKQPHPKNWRPQLLVIANLPSAEDWCQKETTRKLIGFASQLKKGRGLTVAVALHQGEPSDNSAKMIAAQLKKELQEEMAIAKVRGFCSSLIYGANQLEGALSTLIQSCGVGPLRPNTLLIPYPEGSHIENIYWQFLQRLQRSVIQGMCLLVLKGISYFPENEYRMAGNIDIWWILHDGGLLLLVSFLLKQHKVWRNCHLRIFVVVQHEDNKAQMKLDMEKFLYEMRIDAELFLTEFETPDISAYDIQRSLEIDVSNLSKKKRSTMAQVILDQHRKQSKIRSETKNGVQAKRGKAEARFQATRVDTRTQLTEHAENSAYLDRPQLLPFRIAHFNNNSADGDMRERQFTFSSPPTEVALNNPDNQKSSAASLNRIGHSPEQHVMRAVHSAVRLNGKIFEMSNSSTLIVLNLPEPPKKEAALSNYMEYLNVLTRNLCRVLLVRGSGSEVITMYS